MDLALGIVCGHCDRYSALGAFACSECGQPLSLQFRPGDSPEPEAEPESERPIPLSQPPRGSRPSGFKLEPSASSPSPGEVQPVRAPDPREQRHPTDPVVGEIAFPELGGDSWLSEPLRPRRAGRRGDEGPASGSFPASAGRIPIAAVAPSAGPAAPLPRASENTLEDAPPISAPASSRPQYPASAGSSPALPELSLEERMDQAKNFVCRSCQTPVPIGHKFCGRCGAAVPPDILVTRTQFFGQLQAPGKAKLILIRGEGVEGLSYQLSAEQHIVGRNGQLVFPDDPFVSPRHANLFYRNGRLVARDEGSLNGVFLRVRGTVEVASGDEFLVGEQLFRLDVPQKPADAPGTDGTYFYSSPKHPSTFAVEQILQGGATGMVVHARGSTLQIGREGGDLNFPSDLYMSASHCKLEERRGTFALTDLGSRNGTYVRLKAEKELSHGDYLFIGRKLLRVEITAA